MSCTVTVGTITSASLGIDVLVKKYLSNYYKEFYRFSKKLFFSLCGGLTFPCASSLMSLLKRALIPS